MILFLKQEIQEKESILKDLENRINEILILLPNVPHESMPRWILITR